MRVSSMHQLCELIFFHSYLMQCIQCRKEDSIICNFFTGISTGQITWLSFSPYSHTSIPLSFARRSCPHVTVLCVRMTPRD